MNNKQYELIGESIWNTYSDIANIIQGKRQDEGKVIDKVKAVATHIKDVVLKKKPLRSTYKDKERKVGEYQKYGIPLGDKWEKGSGERKPERRQKRRGYQGKMPNLTGDASPLDRYIDVVDPEGRVALGGGMQPWTKRRTTKRNRAWDSVERASRRRDG